MVARTMIPQTGQRMTTEAFRALPETNAARIEHIEGIVYMDSPVYSHQEAVLKAAILLNTIAPHGTTVIAPMDVYLDDNTCQPDVFWVGAKSNCKLNDDGKWAGSPDLIIEVLSPSTAALDQREKFEPYQQHGIGELWLVDILADEHFIEVYTSSGHKFERVGAFVTGDEFTSTILAQSVDAATILGKSPRDKTSEG